jgi:hypothetical protein
MTLTSDPGLASDGSTGTYVLVRDVPASWEGYRAIEASLDPVPPGLLLHLAGPTDEGFRIVEVWASEADSARFADVLRTALGLVDPVMEPLPLVRELRPRHVVCGPAGFAEEGRRVRC